MTIACYTAIFGGYDELKPHPPTPGVDFYCYTDQPRTADGWTVIVPRENHPCFKLSTPRMQAKWFKMHPHLQLPQYAETVWVDAGQTILTDHYPQRCMDAVDESGLALHRHPEDRDCLFDEAPYSLSVHPAKYGPTSMMEQVGYYRALGMPPHFGLWACGTLAVRQNERVRQLFDLWWSHNLHWSYQDQVSFPFVCWATRFHPAEFDWDQYDETETIIGGHNRMD